MMKSVTVFIVISIMLILVSTTSLVGSDKQQFCNNYANTAVKQYYQAKKLFDTHGLAWSDNREGHYFWCMSVPENVAKNEQNKRQAEISEHQGATQQSQAPKQQPVMGVATVAVESLDVGALIGMAALHICENYARESVGQNKQNLSLDCGFKPPSWSSNFNVHKNWCLHGNNSLQSDKHLADRKKQLARCNGNDLILIQEMVLGLRHSANNRYDTFLPATKYYASKGIKFVKREVPDLKTLIFNPGLAAHWNWITTNRGTYSRPEMYKLPPGIVIGLSFRTVDNHKTQNFKVFGFSAAEKGPGYLQGGSFKKECGGDLGAPSGVGMCWYESTGIGFKDWSLVDNLPKGTVVGLKHNTNQLNKKMVWKNTVYDPSDPNIQPPPGFARKKGGDLGAPSGVGYFWYEKITGE